jgi:hypothetical protein
MTQEFRKMLDQLMGKVCLLCGLFRRLLLTLPCSRIETSCQQSEVSGTCVFCFSRMSYSQLPPSPESAAEKVNLSDRKLCPYYLVEYCPHELFTNTKSDLGPCTREHDEHARAAFQALPLAEQWPYGYHT